MTRGPLRRNFGRKMRGKSNATRCNASRSGCAVMRVGAGGKPAYLAVSLSGKTGNAPLYVVGPMPQRTCLANGDSIAAQLTSNPSEHVLSKSCAATARESASVEGCHLSSTMAAMPDLPTAHLWKYDCIAPAAEAHPKAEAANSKGSQKKRTAAIAILPQAESASQSGEGATAGASDSEAPAAPRAFPLETTSSVVVANVPAPVSVSTAGAAPPFNQAPTINQAPTTNPAPAINSAPAINAANDAGNPRQPAPVAVPDLTSAAPSPIAVAAAADELTPVRTKDPEAAIRIASYCSKMTSGAANATTVAMRCRQDEVEAWTRLTVQNEFPTLDDTSRRKCNQPPFPDSFVARENCGKNKLHFD